MKSNLWCPLFGVLPDVAPIPSSPEYQCIKIIIEARKLVAAHIEADYPQNLLKFARTIQRAYMSIYIHSLFRDRPEDNYYTNKDGDIEPTNTLASRQKLALYMAKGSQAYGYVDEAALPHFVSAVLAIITAHRALEDMIKHGKDNDDLLTAKDLLSLSKETKMKAAQSLRASMPRTRNGITPDERAKRNQQIVEHFKGASGKGNITMSGYAKKYEKKYGLKQAQIRKILKNHVAT